MVSFFLSFNLIKLVQGVSLTCDNFTHFLLSQYHIMNLSPPLSFPLSLSFKALFFLLGILFITSTKHVKPNFEYISHLSLSIEILNHDASEKRKIFFFSRLGDYIQWIWFSQLGKAKNKLKRSLNFLGLLKLQ